MNILIAEDQPPAALVLRRMLEKLGHQVLVAPDGESAWRIVCDGKTPILITDWMMPGLNGVDLCRRIRAAAGDHYTYIILLTARDRHDDRLEGLRAGADDFLTKPTCRDELILRLEIAERILAVHDRLARQNLQLAHQASHDGLTGLPNRSHLQRELERRLDRRYVDAPLALLLIDLDHFKDINDAFGHHCGDLLLQALAPRLRDAVGCSGTAARIGGDEFGVVLPGADGAGAFQIAEAIITSLQQPIVITGQELDVGASIGIALCPNHATDPVAMLQCADVAMYRAKQSKAGCLIYTGLEAPKGAASLAAIRRLRMEIGPRSTIAHRL
jgi:diguanylate cyclase (GGDEF)-like protein